MVFTLAAAASDPHALAARCRAQRPHADHCARILDRSTEFNGEPLSPSSPACSRAIDDAFLDNRPMAFTHIPKAAGASFIREMFGRVTCSPTRWCRAEQECYARMISNWSTGCRDFGVMSVVLLRGPRAHVRSQFGQCYFAPWGRMVTNNHAKRHKDYAFRRTADVEADFDGWVRHFAELPPAAVGSRHDFDCIDPRDLQTRHLQCRRARPTFVGANHVRPDDPTGVDLALTNMADADFIGLADFYHQSLCMLKLRRSATATLPRGCCCDDTAAPTAPRCPPAHGVSKCPTAGHAHEAHGVPTNFSNATTKPETLALIDGFTRRDARLFVAALARFRRDIAAAERVAGCRILCDAAAVKADELAQTYSSV